MKETVDEVLTDPTKKNKEPPVPSKMHGVVISKYGSVRVLEYSKSLSTKPLYQEFMARPGNVVIKIHCAAVNRLDVNIRTGALYESYFPQLPHILGKDASGVVVLCGSAVKKFKVGDPVFGFLPQLVPSTGTYCEYSVFDESYLALKPENVSFAEAAALPLSGSTAYECLTTYGKPLKSDDKKPRHLFIYGASGGVGIIAIQLAKLLQCSVTVACSSGAIDVCKSYGADSALDIEGPSLLNSIQSKIDVAIDCVGKLPEYIGEYMSTGGKIISLVGRGMFGNIAKNILGWFGGFSYEFPTINPNGNILAELGRLVSEKKLRIPIEQVYPLSDIGNAHEHLMDSEKKKIGKIIIDISQQSGTSHRKASSSEKDPDNFERSNNVEVQMNSNASILSSSGSIANKDMENTIVSGKGGQDVGGKSALGPEESESDVTDLIIDSQKHLGTKQGDSG